MVEQVLPAEPLEGQLTFYPEMEAEPFPKSGTRDIHVPETDDIASWKLPILAADLIRRFEGCLPEEWLYEMLVSAGHISHFQYWDAIGALLDSGSILETKREGIACYVLTELGMRSTGMLRDYVPKIFRDKVHLGAVRYVQRQQALKDLKIVVEAQGDGYQLCLRCMDHEREMFFLRIQTASQVEAEALGECILRNPARFFGKIIDLALSNEEEPVDLSDN